MEKYSNNDFPYNYYSFEDFDVASISFDSTATLYAKELLIKTGISYLENEFVFYGTDGVYEPQEDTTTTVEIKRSSTYSSLVFNGNVSLNPIEFVFSTGKNIYYSDDFYFPISSEILKVYIKSGIFTVNSKLKVINGAEVYIAEDATIDLHNDLIIYDKITNKENYDNYRELPEDAGKFEIFGNLYISTSLSIGGSLISDSLTDLLSKINSVNVNPYLYNNEGCLVGDDYEIVTHFESYLYVKDSNNSNLYYRFTNGYYYDYSEGSENTSIKTSDGTKLAYKENGVWILCVNGEEVTTDVSDDTIFSYESLTNNYVLNNNGTWSNVSNIDEKTHTYKDEDSTYINVNGKLLSGKFITKKIIFQVSADSKKYIYDEDEGKWVYIHIFEHGYLGAVVKDANLSPNVEYNANNYSEHFVLDTSYVRHDAKSYDKSNHIITLLDDSKYIIYQTSKTNDKYSNDLLTSEISDRKSATGTKGSYIFLKDESTWVQGSFSSYGNYYFESKRDGDNFVYTNNKKWERANIFDNEYTEGFYLFQLFDAKDENCNFAIYDNDSNLAYIITKKGSIELTKENLAESDLTNLLPEDKENYIGYRYFERNGKFCILMEDKNVIDEKTGESKIIIKELDIEPSLTYYDEEKDGRLTAKLLLELLKISIDGSYYYITLERAVASGSDSSLTDNSYLALGIYTDEVPDLLKIFNV